MYKLPRGTKDILPEEAIIWSYLERKAQSVFNLFGFKEIRTPIIEEKKLFLRTLGQDTEIVQKQMFEIIKENDSFVLRPEGTAGIIRAYLENNLDKTDKFRKLYYLGPMFRAERPQKGRLRQFHHIGAEAIGSYNPYLDLEVLSLMDSMIKCFGITNYTIKLNSIGCADDKSKLSALLRERIKPHLKSLCAHCRERYNTNVLRILDCKDPACQNVKESLDLDYSQYLCEDCQAHFHIILTGLNSLGIDYLLVPFLVRGLDYYTRTVFEVTHPDLGSQDAIGAGGRYDNLVQELGGSPAGAVGFALGIERLILLIERAKYEKLSKNECIKLYIATLGNEAYKKGFQLLRQLRDNGISADIDYEGASLKSQLRTADKLAVKYVIILGEDEIKNNAVMLKDMVSGQQEQVAFEKLIEQVKLKIDVNRVESIE